MDGLPAWADVIIVGAGPTGLVLACELQRRNVDYLLLDREEYCVTSSRALGVQARSIEIFEDLGVVEEALANGVQMHGERLFVDGAVAVDWDFDKCDSPYAYPLILEQSETERILFTRLLELGGKDCIKRPVEVKKIHIGRLPDEGVSVMVEALPGTKEVDDDQVETHVPPEEFVPPSKTIRGRYIVGCDGARSIVRKACGIPFPGSTLPNEFIVADVRIKWGVPNEVNKFNLMSANGRMICCLPLTKNRWRLITIRRTGVSDGEIVLDPSYYTKAPTREELQTLVQKVVPGSLIDEVLWGSCYSINSRCAAAFKHHNAFIAGDAAHIHPPLGHQGMNVGIQDAHNLGWKLALVVNGGAMSSLLDTYDQERRPVGESIVYYTSVGYKELIEAKGWVKWSMKNVLPMVFSINAVNRALSHSMSMTSIRYPPSLDETLVGRSHIPGAIQPGQRAPDAYLGMINEKRGTEFVRLHQLLATPHSSLLLLVRVPMTGESEQKGFIGWLGEMLGAHQARKDPGVARALESAVHLSADVSRRTGVPSRSPHTGTRLLLIFTAGKASIVPSVTRRKDGMEGGSLLHMLQNVHQHFARSIGLSREDLLIAWDVDGEVVKNYKLATQLDPFDHSGAFVSIRPDGYVSHHGLMDDHEATDSYIAALDKLF
ncbi:unnamed protein product [Vitrella brassicaformis CCMP3155]|uniref:FAD-binding domain-containing protein n=1 Tax=Vitrella brassicaformis (strain CCMP3155) TaxID=1169540 RepID=A0A0G4G307_VITBC|nr:unnamed protein product [Vitrella brassicaformis CCMP3155]|mmetsp:Transcript_26517/g.76021  ORF Transcript_26517/g.76021 Transcript_26517/m.76021 type:complete len:659 (+) Transcript_26517:139-2115(+)|eukprot:CEM22610.1 unnamed protein product [Vitrella brassicaformis CCMP3155]